MADLLRVPINRYWVSHTAPWRVIRRVSLTRLSGGNAVCEHETRYSARVCCWGRNGWRAGEACSGARVVSDG